MAISNPFRSRYSGTIVATAITAGMVPVLGVVMERLVPEGALAYAGAMIIAVLAILVGALYFAHWWERQRRRSRQFFEQAPGDKSQYRVLVATIGHFNPKFANDPSLTSQVANNLLRPGEEAYVYLVGLETDSTKQEYRRVVREFETGMIPDVTAQSIQFIPFENSAEGINDLSIRIGAILDTLEGRGIMDEDIVFDYTGGLASMTSALVQCGVKYQIDMHYYFNPENQRVTGRTAGESILSRVHRDSPETN